MAFEVNINPKTQTFATQAEADAFIAQVKTLFGTETPWQKNEKVVTYDGKTADAKVAGSFMKRVDEYPKPSALPK